MKQDNGAPLAAPKPFLTEEAFFAIMGEVYERLVNLENTTDDLERRRDGADKTVDSMRERLAEFEES